MFKLVGMKDTIRIPPSEFGKPLKEVAVELLKSKYEGLLIPEVGLIVSILNVKVSEIGRIYPRDPSLHHEVEFDALVYIPLLHELVEGEVMIVEDIGVFVRIGPIDGFIHKSQIQDDYFTYDKKQATVVGLKSKRVLRKGDIVRARIVSISMSSQRSRGLRVALTMRQPFLGKIEWIREELRKLKKGTTGK
ncbi:MAG: DNA-directed RNA polymerase [Thermofilum sp. ex4484_15]|nr:MAG: DNA-directed RNA polymerase [Thermofilum sp. ex4484_15]